MTTEQVKEMEVYYFNSLDAMNEFHATLCKDEIELIGQLETAKNLKLDCETLEMLLCASVGMREGIKEAIDEMIIEMNEFIETWVKTQLN